MAENFPFLKSNDSVMIYVLVSVCIIFLILTYYKLFQRQWLDFSFRRGTRMVRHNLVVDEELHYRSGQSVGLASSVILSLPAVQFKESIRKGGNNDSNTDCAVCLTEFEEGDWLRLLPNCAHVFHVACVDIWFRTHSTCPLCRMNVLYDFNSPGSSASGVALLASLRREDPCQERPLGHRLLDTLTMQNPEYRLGGILSRIESDSEESLPAVSPLMGGTNNRITVENLVKLAHSYKGESSNANRNASPDVRLQVRR